MEAILKDNVACVEGIRAAVKPTSVDFLLVSCIFLCSLWHMNVLWVQSVSATFNKLMKELAMRFLSNGGVLFQVIELFFFFFFFFSFFSFFSIATIVKATVGTTGCR